MLTESLRALVQARVFKNKNQVTCALLSSQIRYKWGGFEILCGGKNNKSRVLCKINGYEIYHHTPFTYVYMQGKNKLEK